MYNNSESQNFNTPCCTSIVEGTCTCQLAEMRNKQDMSRKCTCHKVTHNYNNPSEMKIKRK